MDKRDVDQILNKRFTPDAPSNLSARIIDASKAMPQNDKGSIFGGFGQFLQNALGGFSIPQPALALAAFVLLGLAVVFYSAEVLHPEAASE